MTKRNSLTRRLPILSFIGAGSVGTALATALYDRGYKVASVISSHARSAKALAKYVKAPNASDRLEDVSALTQVLFITTPDKAIGVTAADLAKRKDFSFSEMAFVHTSGALGSEALSPLRDRGGHVLCLHPIQLFPRGERPNALASRLSGIHFGLEGDDIGLAMGKKLVRNLGGKPLLIRPELKVLYHVACVVASNYLVALMSLVEEVYCRLDLEGKKSVDVFRPLIRSTIESVARSSPSGALTGPIERGDVETIRLHLRELTRSAPYLIPFYTVMGMETIRLAVRKGSLTPRQATTLLDVVSGYIRGEQKTELLSQYLEHRN
jgi:predicted short-subunit dehydrogenase-like oxidoreductase (DUF2520 family)